jgi:hypothetical protein
MMCKYLRGDTSLADGAERIALPTCFHPWLSAVSSNTTRTTPSATMRPSPVGNLCREGALYPFSPEQRVTNWGDANTTPHPRPGSHIERTRWPFDNSIVASNSHSSPISEARLSAP